ncbi:MAG: isoaspartyl peptidase/L-asparaginase [Legionellaceae bacterium]|nr:isoaspartyl peptidase/L-asparaginase [Legionellaceae bacterium]
MFKYAILSHGGSGSSQDDSDGPLAAANVGMELMKHGYPALDAVIHAVVLLENDPRFNAGTGSQLRSDEQTIQMDAACMNSTGDFGAVACVEAIKNPILLAEKVLLNSPHIILAGDGARIFAKTYNLATPPLNQTNLRNKPGSACDTVGAIAFDGLTFAASLSSGGLANSVIGRVGDVPLPGCGLFCGPVGSVACTGDGEFIALKILAKTVYGWLEQRMHPEDAGQKAMDLFDQTVDLGLIILTKNGYALISRNKMACANLTEVE